MATCIIALELAACPEGHIKVSGRTVVRQADRRLHVGGERREGCGCDTLHPNSK